MLYSQETISIASYEVSFVSALERTGLDKIG